MGDDLRSPARSRMTLLRIDDHLAWKRPSITLASVARPVERGRGNCGRGRELPGKDLVEHEALSRIVERPTR